MVTTIPDAVSDAFLDVVLTGEAAITDHYGDLWVYLCDADPAETGANQVAELAAQSVALNSRQEVTVSNATGGTFTLTYDLQETAPIAFDASAADVQAALEALSSIGAGNVVCVGGALSTNPVEIIFVRDFRWLTVDPLTFDDSGLTNGGTQEVTINTTFVVGFEDLTPYADANGEIERETDTDTDIEFGEASGPNTATHLALSYTDDNTGFLAGVQLAAPVPYETSQPVRISAGNLRAFSRGAQ